MSKHANGTGGGSRWVGDGRMASSEQTMLPVSSRDAAAKHTAAHRLPAPVLSVSALSLFICKS